jgi:hypothetical protein
MRIFFTPVLLLYPTAAWTQEAPPSGDCSSIEFILANPKICDKRPVRLTSKVVEFKHQVSQAGKPYTEFTLADGPVKLRFFSYDHLPLRKGVCFQVEGIYHVRREVGPSVFKNDVVVEKKTEGITSVSCPPEEKMKEKPKAPFVPSPEAKKVEGQQKVNDVPPASSVPVWSWSEIISVGLLILILLAVVANRVLRPSRYYRMGRDFEEYVIGLFPDTEWEIEDRSSDTSKRIGRRVTGDVSYDCIVKHRPTSRRFILQCKYRSHFFRQDGQEGIEWAKPYQIGNYRNFQQIKGWPYVVIIGVGGRPRKPQQLFVLPLEHLGSPFIGKIDLQAAKRGQHGFFTVSDQGVLG